MKNDLPFSIHHGDSSDGLIADQPAADSVSADSISVDSVSTGRYPQAASDDAGDLRIFSLGQFGVVRGEWPVRSSGKSQRRPLALLQALIAHGAHDVSCSILWECLWPDSDGDLGARNLTITLHRLRNLLGSNAAVLHHDGKLSLNPRLCWVDVWEFERLVNEALHMPAHRVEGKAWESQLRTALGLYTGHFLALEAEEFWMLEPRMRWKTKFERAVTALSVFLEREGRFPEAIDLCLQALELDPLNELLYRRLMNCYLLCGETAAVAKTYAICREALSKGLDAQPSAETDRIYRLAAGTSAKGQKRSAAETRLPLKAGLQSAIGFAAG